MNKAIALFLLLVSGFTFATDKVEKKEDIPKSGVEYQFLLDNEAKLVFNYNKRLYYQIQTGENKGLYSCPLEEPYMVWHYCMKYGINY